MIAAYFSTTRRSFVIPTLSYFILATALVPTRPVTTHYFISGPHCVFRESRFRALPYHGITIFKFGSFYPSTRPDNPRKNKR